MALVCLAVRRQSLGPVRDSAAGLRRPRSRWRPTRGAGNEHAKSFFTGVLATAAGDAVLGAVRRHRGRLRAGARARRRSSPSSLALGARPRAALSRGRRGAAAGRVRCRGPGRWMALAERRRSARPQPGRHRALARARIVGGADRHRLRAAPASAARDVPWIAFDAAPRSARLRRRRQGRVRRRHRRLVHHLPGQQVAGARRAATVAGGLNGAGIVAMRPTGPGPIRRIADILGALRALRHSLQRRLRAGRAGRHSRCPNCSPPTRCSRPRTRPPQALTKALIRGGNSLTDALYALRAAAPGHLCGAISTEKRKGQEQ